MKTRSQEVSKSLAIMGFPPDNPVYSYITETIGVKSMMQLIQLKEQDWEHYVQDDTTPLTWVNIGPFLTLWAWIELQLETTGSIPTQLCLSEIDELDSEEKFARLHWVTPLEDSVPSHLLLSSLKTPNLLSPIYSMF